MRKKEIISIASALVIVTTYTVACIVFSFSDNKTREKQEPEGLRNLRPGLERVGKESDPLLREYMLQEEAANSNKTVNDYRLLFQSYRRNKTEFLPEYPKYQWSILAWGFWFFKEVTPNKQTELLKNSFLTIIEKGALITGVIAVGKWLWESPQRRKQEQYQAWQIIHLADGKRVSGARKQALEDLNKQKASLAGLVAEKADLNRVSLKKAKLSGAKLNYADLNYADLSGADLIDAQMVGAHLDDAHLDGAYLVGTRLGGAGLRRAYLRGACLIQADLTDALLGGADLSGAELQCARLSGAHLSGVDLRSAHLDGADLSGVDLSGAKNLTVKQVERAKNLEKAKYTKEFRAELGLPPDPAK
ncbi:MAG: pentapeptide repeat-containing protein [Hassallia sp. WJT32-NPBG1]|jgi:uncharacterized protein YjbI with pentapeptide repeats|nr:pentapeptide repeat-containing protein [Hassallia sp. WJT32-NPBG1]